jgi:crotonobetaine/carnitine-CoA ligase
MAGAFPETIPALLEARANDARQSRAPWLLFEGSTWTLADVLGEVDRYAVGLAERGVSKGDRVAVLAGNRPEALFSWFGANQLGAIAAPLNHALKPPELAAFFRLTKPRVLVATSPHRALAEAACAALDDAERPAIASPEELGSAGRGAPRAEVSGGDVAVLIATSGTTGLPKAVAQTHRTYTLTAEAFPWWVGLSDADRLLAALPLFHINAQAYSVMGALGAGASLAILPKFSASTFWEDARRLGATEFNSVGAMIHILLKTEPRAADRGHGSRTRRSRSPRRSIARSRSASGSRSPSATA